MSAPVRVATKYRALTIDTGAELNLLSDKAFLTLRLSLNLPVQWHDSHVLVSGADGKIFHPLGSELIRFRFHRRAKPVTKILGVKRLRSTLRWLFGFANIASAAC